MCGHALEHQRATQSQHGHQRFAGEQARSASARCLGDPEARLGRKSLRDMLIIAFPEIWQCPAPAACAEYPNRGWFGNSYPDGTGAPPSDAPPRPPFTRLAAGRPDQRLLMLAATPTALMAGDTATRNSSRNSHLHARRVGEIDDVPVPQHEAKSARKKPEVA